MDSTIKDRQIEELESGRWIGVTKAAEELAVSRPHIHSLYSRRVLRGIKTDIGLLLDRQHAGYVAAKREGMVRAARQTRQEAR